MNNTHAKCLQFAAALVDVMDGMADHEIQAETGLPEADCERIAKAREEARQFLYPVSSQKKEQMMEYKIIARGYISNLEDAVNAELAKGWRLVGGLSVAAGSGLSLYSPLYSQAMIGYPSSETESEQDA